MHTPPRRRARRLRRALTLPFRPLMRHRGFFLALLVAGAASAAIIAIFSLATFSGHPKCKNDYCPGVNVSKWSANSQPTTAAGDPSTWGIMCVNASADVMPTPAKPKTSVYPCVHNTVRTHGPVVVHFTIIGANGINAYNQGLASFQFTEYMQTRPSKHAKARWVKVSSPSNPITDNVGDSFDLHMTASTYVHIQLIPITTGKQSKPPKPLWDAWIMVTITKT